MSKQNVEKFVDEFEGISKEIKRKVIILMGLLAIISLAAGWFAPAFINKQSISLEGKWLFLILLVVVLLLSYIIGKFTTRPLLKLDYSVSEDQQQLAEALSELADSAERVTRSGFGETIAVERDDEIGRLAETFNYLLENVSGFVRELDRIAEESSGTGRQLTDATHRTSRAMEEVNTTLQELSAASEQMSHSIDDIATGAEEVDNLAQGGLEQMQNMENEMEKIMQVAGQAGDRIKELNQASDEISKIVDVISGIAKQTNLLALNAAIEAARAGEHGRGFAVVADEVRELAQDTQNSLEEIGNFVSNLTGETTKAVEIIESNNRQIEEGEQILRETSSTFRVIAENIQQMVDGINQIAAASRQVSEGSREISTSTARQTTAITEITDLAQHLANMSAELKETLADSSVGGVKIDIDLNKFDRGMSEINELVQNRLKEELGIEGKFVIGMIARLEPIKGHKFFFEGLQSLLMNNSNIACLIIGDGSLGADLEQLIESKGLTDRVHFLGYREDIQRLLSIIDLVVLTSKKEGMPPRIIMEAMAAGNPVVATDVPGSRHLINQEKNGILVKYGEVDALQQALNYFVTNPEKCSEYGRNGRKMIERLVK